MEPGAPSLRGFSSSPSPPPPPPPPPPTTTIVLGKYKLGRLLGRGSFAKVYQAVSLEDNHNNNSDNSSSDVAIKIIDKTKPITSIMEPHIIREVAVMRRLQPHSNILKIHEVMATKSKIYLVMELASGGELFSKIARRGRLNEPTARRYFQQLVSTLRFCHQNGVAHRDIKPQNLLLDRNGVLKISDFGLSALPEQRRNGLLHTACGTPAYTAPEVVGRCGYDGSKADAWSCGVILYVLLAGHLPFDDNNLVSMYKKTKQREYSFPDCISKPARFLINRLLDPNPNSRMTLEELMTTPWFKKNLNNTRSSEEKPEALLKDNDKSDVVSGMNAFDIISMSSGLDLSGLFETSNKKGKRFTSSASYEAIVEKMGEVGSKLGYKIEKGKGGGVIGLGKERLAMLAIVLEIAESLVLVEVKVIEGGVDSEEVQWGNWIDGLKEIVLSWHNDVV